MVSDLQFWMAYTIVLVTCLIGFIFGIYNCVSVLSIDTSKLPGEEDQQATQNDNAAAEVDKDKKIDEKNIEKAEEKSTVTSKHIKDINYTAEKIQEGANTFLFWEYIYLGIFLIVFAVVLVVIDPQYRFFTAIAFLVGALTSLASGYIGMYVATRSNVRVTFLAATTKSDPEKPEEKLNLLAAFNAAFRGGCTMGFCLVSLALSILTFMIMIYIALLKPADKNITQYIELFEFIAGYGLGGSTVALFCRVGGGIYTKAADVGADLVGKNDLNLPEDSPENPATIADNVGDNVGDIAGMGADLFGSFAEATCAALVVSGTSVELCTGANFFYPLILTASGILVCILTSFFATHIMTVTSFDKIQTTLSWQIIISSVLLTPTIVGISNGLLPKTVIFNKGTTNQITSTSWQLMICVLAGLWAGMIIGYVTDYYTSNTHGPTQNLAKYCTSGAAINVIQGLALGYLSCLIPIIAIAVTIYAGFSLAGMYGISLAALGMLSNLSICLAIDGYGPISDNAGGISEMAEMPKFVREVTDALDAAGNTTAAMGKGFAIGSACLVSLALFGAFITRTKMFEVNILEPMQISCLIVGAMMPYAFSAFTMRSVGLAATDMCNEVTRQHTQKEQEGTELDHNRCIAISTSASLREMILPGLLVIGTPILLGGLFGPKAVSGYLAGVIVSGVQMAISASNTGGAWDNAKKYIEAQKLEITEEKEKGGSTEKMFYKKHSKPHKAAVVGDTVGDPLKDTSGPSLNILIKLSAIISLVFGSFFANYHVVKNV